MKQEQLDEIIQKHKLWLNNNAAGERANLEDANLEGTNLEYANLKYANLKRANLEDANLEGANIDYSVWPLWGGSKNVKVDIIQVRQLLAHVYVLDCADKEFKDIKSNIFQYAVKSHVADDLCIKKED